VQLSRTQVALKSKKSIERKKKRNFLLFFFFFSLFLMLPHAHTLMDGNGFLNALLTTTMPKKLQNNSLTQNERDESEREKE
jgi:hypothetical protein